MVLVWVIVLEEAVLRIVHMDLPQGRSSIAKSTSPFYRLSRANLEQEIVKHWEQAHVNQ